MDAGMNNALLRSLPPESYDALAEHLEPQEFKLGESHWKPGSKPSHIYFPETAVLSGMALDSSGRTVEASMVGNEGASGLAEAMGSGEFSLEILCQVDGRAWKVPVGIVRELVRADRAFSTRIWQAVEYQMIESRQTALCNALHLVERRFPRWLLESYDRSRGRNPLPLRQEFLAAMLGVQRTTVSMFATELQRTGMISYHRGQIELHDFAGLESRACECRRIIAEQRVRLGLTPSEPVSVRA